MSDVMVIGLAGGTGSGKTTITKKLMQRFGGEVSVIYEFFSKEDLQIRTKLTSTNIQDLSDMGVLDNLKETDQLSLFDF